MSPEEKATVKKKSQLKARIFSASNEPEIFWVLLGTIHSERA